MSSEDLKTLMTDVTYVRTKMRSDPRLQLEFKAALSSLLRQYNVDIGPETLSSLTIAVYPELNESSLGVILPVPDLGPLK